MENAGFYGFRRIFNQGADPKTYQWNKGGRLYCVGEENFQNMSGIRRRGITIDGELCVEVDITASHFTIYHAILRAPFNPFTDPYDVKDVPRSIVKQWVLMAFGAGEFPKRWSRDAGIDYRKEIGRRSLGKDYPIRKVQDAMTTKHPALSMFPFSGITWADLQYRESQAIVATMLRLLREKDAPSFPIHDSLLVKARDAKEASLILKGEYQRIVGIRPELKVKVSEAVRKEFPRVEFAAEEL
jgi:hypothetical protein